MALIRGGLLALLCAAFVVGDAGASFPGRNGPIVYASSLLPAPASGVVEFQLGPRVVRRSLTSRTDISGLLPAESPDGALVAFARRGRLYVSRRDGSGVRDLGRGARPSWSPDGTKLAFSIWDRYQTLIVVDAATGERSRLGEGSNPSWSPDGARLAFVHYQGLGLVNADGTGLRILSPRRMSNWNNLDAPSWSPDGHRIAFSAVDAVYQGTPHAPGVVVVDVSNGATLALNEWARHPDWSPSGSSLVYVRTKGSASLKKEVVVLDVERRTRRVVATAPFSEQCERRGSRSSLAFGAAFSPLTNRIAFASTVRRHGRCRVSVGIVAPGGRARIVHTEPFGTRPAGFIDDDIGEAGPRWLRDGSGVWLGIARRTLEPELYVRSEDGTGLRRLSRTAVGEHDPRFSADGRRIVFVRGRRGRDGVIWVTDVRGRNQRRIGAGSYPTWSPDGRRLAFTRRGSLYTMAVTGGRPTRLAHAPARMPSWSPDGRLVAFAGADGSVEREVLEARSSGIFTVDTRTRRVRRLTSDGLFPNWSPDGRLVAYMLWADEPEPGKSDFPYLRLVSREGVSVDPGSAYVFAYDVAWAPTGDRLVGSWLTGSLTTIRPPILGGNPRLPNAPIPSALGIQADERDPDWQP